MAEESISIEMVIFMMEIGKMIEDRGQGSVEVRSQ